MKYEEPKVQLEIPVTILRRIRDCLKTELRTPDNEDSRSHEVRRAKNEKAMMIVSNALLEHDVNQIVGDSLSDESLKAVFPLRKKKRVPKKQRD